MGVRYTNRAITTEQQIDILKERGLLIDDVERAVKALDIISYFRLAGYWRHFEGSPDKPGGLSIQLCKSEKKEFLMAESTVPMLIVLDCSWYKGANFL